MRSHRNSDILKLISRVVTCSHSYTYLRLALCDEGATYASPVVSFRILFVPVPFTLTVTKYLNVG